MMVGMGGNIREKILCEGGGRGNNRENTPSYMRVGVGGNIRENILCETGGGGNNRENILCEGGGVGNNSLQMYRIMLFSWKNKIIYIIIYIYIYIYNNNVVT
jgi:hypothetical protein